MAAYGGAGLGRAAVDTGATAATRKVAGTPPNGRPGNGVVSTVFDFCRRSPVLGPSDGKWNTCLAKNQVFLRSNRRAATNLHADLTGTAYLGGLNPLASRFESGGLHHRRAADGNWHTWVAQNDSFLRSNRRPRTRHDIAQSPLLEFSR